MATRLKVWAGVAGVAYGAWHQSFWAGLFMFSVGLAAGYALYLGYVFIKHTYPESE